MTNLTTLLVFQVNNGVATTDPFLHSPTYPLNSFYLPFLQSPPKGATIPYRPKPVMPPVIFAGGQAYTIQGQVPVPSPEVSFFVLLLLLILHSVRFMIGHHLLL